MNPYQLIDRTRTEPPPLQPVNIVTPSPSSTTPKPTDNNQTITIDDEPVANKAKKYVWGSGSSDEGLSNKTPKKKKGPRKKLNRFGKKTVQFEVYYDFKKVIVFSRNKV